MAQETTNNQGDFMLISQAIYENTLDMSYEQKVYLWYLREDSTFRREKLQEFIALDFEAEVEEDE